MPVTDEFHGRAPLYFCFIILMTMNGEFKHIFKELLPGVLLACMALLSSCADDAGDSDRHGSTATLQMQVSTRAEGDQTGTEDKQPGGAYENIHSLCVLLVNAEDNVAWKYVNDNLSDDASETEFLSEPIQDLPLGAYDVYAFANFDYYTNGARGAAGLWTTLKNLVEGAPFDERILSLVVDDPASRMDFTQQRYIPMSGKEENFVVSSNTSIIPVTLDRLVSKVQISVSGESAKDVTELTFSGWADKVMLFSDETLSDDVSNEKSITVRDKTVDENGTVVVSPFYVNETPDGHTFNVSVKTNESTAGNPQSVYTATTKQSGLPRNSIYPLAITINNWGLDITAKCWVSPIGHYPVEVVADFTENTYSIEIPEGAQFEFTLNGLTGQGMTGGQCVWNIDPATTPGIAFEGNTGSVETVKGHVTASAGKKFSLNVSATWTDASGNRYQRTYTVNMTTTDIADAVFETGGTRAASPFTRVTEWGGARNVQPEVLDIHVKR